MIDFIGDIHGHADELMRLLDELGYKKVKDAYSHPERTAVFVGDYIDRGPKIRETLRIVRTMVDTGSAIALMGNHEYNAICYNWLDDTGHFLREHSPKNMHQHKKTLEQFDGAEDEYKEYLSWFMSLPLFCEQEGFNAAHACWDIASIESLKKRLINGKLSAELLLEANDKSTTLYQSIENVLKGKELTVENWEGKADKDGHKRPEIRIKWWLSPIGRTYKDLCFPHSDEVPDKLAPANNDPYYDLQQKPVFFGHYWLTGNVATQADNVCCLDYSVAKGGKLAAYRWIGENRLVNSGFHVVSI